MQAKFWLKKAKNAQERLNLPNKRMKKQIMGFDEIKRADNLR